MRYKLGDKVKIKSLDWFKANEYNSQGTYDDVLAFLKMTDECCGKELTIDFIFTDERGTGYIMKEPKVQWRFTDSMIEGLADAPPKMVSLEKVKEWLYKNFYESYNLNDYGKYDLDEPYITSSFDTIDEMIEDFHKTMEK